MEHTAKQFRAKERRSLSFSCACRLPGGLVTEAQFFDLTSRGAKTKFVGIDVMFADRVEIMISDGQWIPGTIRRVGEDDAGIEFDKEIDEHIIERLLFNNPAGIN
jgi:hypothetical protein